MTEKLSNEVEQGSLETNKELSTLQTDVHKEQQETAEGNKQNEEQEKQQQLESFAKEVEEVKSEVKDSQWLSFSQ